MKKNTLCDGEFELKLLLLQLPVINRNQASQDKTNQFFPGLASFMSA